MQRHVFITTLLFLGLAGCSRADTDSPATDALSSDTLTQDQRDSILGESGIPGAAGVRGARRAADSAAARNARIDSIAGATP
jgi:hypothetical protein